MTDRFPRTDPVGPAIAGLTVPGVDVIDALAEQAADTDIHGVARSAIDALAGAGLLGGALQPPAAHREAAELLAGADATTWFCWVQHQTPLRTLEGGIAGIREGAPTSLREEYLPGLQSGRLLGAVAFAHVRRPGPPNPVATRVAGGWRLDGTLDWVTSWDIADVVMVMARAAAPHDDRLVCCYLPGGHASTAVQGVEPGPPLDLLAMGGTHTRPVLLRGLVVPDEWVGAVVDWEEWAQADAVRTCDANPAAFGVARGAIAELDALATDRADAALAEAAADLVAECRRIRERAYGLIDEDGPVTDRLSARADSLDLAVRAATAVVVARAGGAMLRGGSAERRVREAMFLLVQAQTRAGRDASLATVTRTATGGGGP